jgi:predicted metal-dependent peptidase
MKPSPRPCSSASEQRDAVSTLNLKLLRRAPFLATIALHAEVLIREHPQVEIAATDGKRIYLSPSRFLSRPMAEQLFIYAHEVLHCALCHPMRRAGRDPILWNVAADVVVNGLLAASGLAPPADALRDESLEYLSAEAVYEQLAARSCPPSQSRIHDLLEPTAEGTNVAKGYWQSVLRRATTLARLSGAGAVPAGEELAVALGKAQVSWRQHLLRYLISSQNDFQGFDSRLIHLGLYVEALESHSIEVAVHIDTSGSLNSAEEQGRFLAELMAILMAYPQVQVSLTYGDTALYGPYPLTQDTRIPPPKGGGGTSFVPFFSSVKELPLTTPLVVFTDGYGDFPHTCEHPCLWVVTEGGLPSDRFPFGEVARLGS